jgi:predicted metal-dependent phosphoesterase TrpH
VQKLGRAVDWLEVINSRSTKKQNSMAMELSETLNKPKTAGSDAHLYSEIGTSYITIKKVDTIDEIIKEISNGNIQIAKNISSRKVHYWSSFIGALKTRNFRSFIKGVNKELRSVFK